MKSLKLLSVGLVFGAMLLTTSISAQTTCKHKNKTCDKAKVEFKQKDKAKSNDICKYTNKECTPKMAKDCTKKSKGNKPCPNTNTVCDKKKAVNCNKKKK